MLADINNRRRLKSTNTTKDIVGSTKGIIGRLKSTKNTKGIIQRPREHHRNNSGTWTKGTKRTSIKRIPLSELITNINRN